MSKKEKAKSNLNYYNVLKHKVMLWICAVIITIGCIFGFSYAVGGIECLLRLWGFGNIEKNPNQILNSGVLPDFLGGMLGIIIGFFLDWGIFEKIRNLTKYQQILSCLEVEFTTILKSLNLNTEVPLCISELILDEVVLSCENNIILFNLPGYFIFKFKRKGEILKLLQEIHGDIKHRNSAIEQLKAGKDVKCDSKKEPYVCKVDNGEIKYGPETWRDEIIKNIEKFRKNTMRKYWRK